MKRKLISLFLCLSLGITLATPLKTNAAKQSSDKTLDLNLQPAITNVSPTASKYGYIPVDIDIPSVHENQNDARKIILRTGKEASASVLESRYSSYEEGYVPAVRDQRNMNICWAFGINCAMEASMLRNNIGNDTKDTINLSELQMAYYFYHRVTDPLGLTEGDSNTLTSGNNANYLNIGGNNLFTVNDLISWQTPHDESTDPKSFAEINDQVDNAIEPYKNASKEEYNLVLDDAISDAAKDLTFETDPNIVYGNNPAHVQGYYIFNNNDRNEIKQAIKDYGALSMDYYDDPAYYNGTSYYCSEWDTGTDASNHCVALIGWDDEYDKSNFKTNPGIDGAWICRNSWGSDNNYTDKNGIFYISYADKSFSHDNTLIALRLEEKDNYAYNYQYDGSSSSLLKIPGAYTYSNIFTVQGDVPQAIEAVGVGVASTNTSFDIQIYKNVRGSSDPTNGTLVSEASTKGKMTYYGFDTIKLNSPVTVYPGEQYSVVVRFSQSRANMMLDSSTSPYSGYWIRFTNMLHSGQSFIKENGQWYDLSVETEASARIKAYANPLIPINNAEISVEDASYTYDGKAKTPAVTNVTLDGETLDPSNYDVVYQNNINAGTATVTVWGKGDYAGWVDHSFSIAKASSVINASVLSKKINGNSLTANSSFSIDASTNSNGALSYSLISYPTNGKKYLTITSDGTVTVKKGAPAGTYKIQVSNSETNNYKKASPRIITVTVTPATKKTVSLTVSGASSIKRGKSAKINAFAKNYSGTIKWSLNNKSKKYATLSKSTGKKVTLKIKKNAKKRAIITITVKAGTVKAVKKITIK